MAKYSYRLLSAITDEVRDALLACLNNRFKPVSYGHTADEKGRTVVWIDSPKAGAKKDLDECFGKLEWEEA